MQGQGGLALWLICRAFDCPRMFHISKIPNRIRADLQEFLAKSAGSPSLSTLRSRKERVRRLLSQPSGHTCSVEMHNMKHMCFLEKKKKIHFLRATELSLPESVAAFQLSGPRRNDPCPPAAGKPYASSFYGGFIYSLLSSIGCLPEHLRRNSRRKTFKARVFSAASLPSFLPPFRAGSH